MKAKIFISYTSSDQDLLDEFLKYLTSLQWESITTYCYQEGNIQREEFKSQISSADVVVMLVTSAYFDSINCRIWELSQIQEQTTKVIAINLSTVNLIASQFTDFCSPLLDYYPVINWEQKMENLKNAAAVIYEKIGSSTSSELDSSVVSGAVRGIVSLPKPDVAEKGIGRDVERGEDINTTRPLYPVEQPINKIFSNQELQSFNYQDITQLQEQLEQVYRVQEPPAQTVATNKDLIDCSVFSPPAVACGDMFLVQVFVHLPEQAEIAQQQAEQFDSEVKKLGVRSLGIPIARGTELTFALSIPKLKVDDPIQNLVWHGTADSVQFGVTVPADLTQKTVIATVTVSQNSVPIGHLKFKLSIAISNSANSSQPQPVGEAARIYRKAFVSYSSKDRQEVLKRVQGLAVTGIEVFQDVLNLEPGDRWEKELYRHINECDLFLLFWSTAAKESNWVLKEVLYALERQGKDGLQPPEIIPVIIEGPPLVSPPDELQHLHFNDKILYLIAMSK
ncbi:toll/interleukin-1 receptor domain-containing protein [Phormidium sp. LEGE 05292]|uniref:toll/interleukin-1 receptor domain-containing protein n=1 Tax=[Phormidium] sp. LEGE 05292 TaxID=767427 RepID=UPI00187F9036|nr:toll/interleukin-1 receptor domain-containing protein [Phormidium sp. LEGE 05292]MBE9227214.1 toll/interleukin-1 receptor domain-containing protein [Phormidium sp. LEGE 05292]